ncbi:SseB family protein [Roseobacter sp. HKCCA0434]|uniref:SseB family protein n=1 Tax=Roseobacter sp. HKCCA0434 TaxID=3079297 RepID=UPI002905DF37|nr:SseB family protein [Roseobacter sp. HKCCA0434]
MDDLTPLDHAHLAAEADESLRPRFWSRLLEAELYVPLEEEAGETAIRPVVLETGEGRIALAFDRDRRMAEFMEGAAPFAALSGRRLVGLLAAERIGLALNLGGHPSETILPVEALDWAVEQLADLTQVREAAVREVRAPRGVPQVLLEALAAKLPVLEGLAREAWLAGVRYRDGSEGHMLALVDALPQAQPQIAEAMAEAVRLSGLEAGALDITFVAGGTQIVETLRTRAMGFEIPQPAEPVREVIAPGSDPDKPPRLR